MDVKALFSFDGRIGRGAFWKITLISLVVNVVTFGIASVADSGFLMFLAVIVYVVTGVVGLATSVKRWHDRDKSWAWIFIGAIPFIGAIWVFVENGCLPGTDGANQYGLPESGSPFADEPLPHRAAA